METDMTQMIVGHEGLSASGFRKRKRQRSFWQASSRPRVVRGQTRVSMGSVLLAYPHTKKSDVLKIQYKVPKVIVLKYNIKLVHFYILWK